jgi:hypothetical protein
MRIEQHRAARFTFVCAAEVTDVASEKMLNGSTSDLSAFGCFVATPAPFSKDTRVRVKITHSRAKFSALGKVAYTKPKKGMGIVFAGINPLDQAVLEKWLDELRNRST